MHEAKGKYKKLLDELLDRLDYRLGKEKVQSILKEIRPETDEEPNSSTLLSSSQVVNS
jgi:hypothetical protein